MKPPSCLLASCKFRQYRVLGVDRSPELVEAAERAGERARFWVLDMLDLGQLEESFDGVLNLWHSFGFHDAATDRALLDWHLYSPDELGAASEQSGFEVVLRCAWFDAAVPVSPEHARMQFVLERR
jgi:hypothetical protein